MSSKYFAVLYSVTQRWVAILEKIWVWDSDPRSGIRKKPVPDRGSRGSKRHRIPDPEHCWAV
jgi:hypothetical protein